MVRLADLPEWEREHLLDFGWRAPTFATRPWVRGVALRERRVPLTPPQRCTGGVIALSAAAPVQRSTASFRRTPRSAT
mgnify:CR=1 FL=1